MNRPLRARIEVWLHCPDCCEAEIHCPSCGTGWVLGMNLTPSAFPFIWQEDCDACGSQLWLEAIGWQPNPTGERPAAEVLSDRLPALEKAWHKPSASRPTLSVVQLSSPSPAKPQPCHGKAPRRRLADWIAAGMVPRDATATGIAAAYCRVFGQPPRRDPNKRAVRAYSLRELGLALGCLGLAFPADPAAEIRARREVEQ